MMKKNLLKTYNSSMRISKVLKSQRQRRYFKKNLKEKIILKNKNKK